MIRQRTFFSKKSSDKNFTHSRKNLNLPLDSGSTILGITMKLSNIFSLGRTSVLKAHNPRIGTVIIPIGINDSEIFSQYLLNKVQSLQFEGSYKKLETLIKKLADKEGARIIKMRVTMGRKGQVLLLHLQYPNSLEVRRVIRLT